MAGHGKTLFDFAFDSDDGFGEFMNLLLPTLISQNAWRHNIRKRKRSKPATLRKRNKIDGRIGRRWTQRKKGDIKPEDFSWWKLINKPDVADLKSRNGKVNFFPLFWLDLFSFSFIVVVLCWPALPSFAFICIALFLLGFALLSFHLFDILVISFDCVLAHLERIFDFVHFLWLVLFCFNVFPVALHYLVVFRSLLSFVLCCFASMCFHLYCISLLQCVFSCIALSRVISFLAFLCLALFCFNVFSFALDSIALF